MRSKKVKQELKRDTVPEEETRNKENKGRNENKNRENGR
jgi:hypothetical protein